MRHGYAALHLVQLLGFFERDGVAYWRVMRRHRHTRAHRHGERDSVVERYLTGTLTRTHAAQGHNRAVRQQEVLSLTRDVIDRDITGFQFDPRALKELEDSVGEVPTRPDVVRALVKSVVGDGAPEVPRGATRSAAETTGLAGRVGRPSRRDYLRELFPMRHRPRRERAYCAPSELLDSREALPRWRHLTRRCHPISLQVPV